jgi:predicted nucleic-acid-binding protein
MQIILDTNVLVRFLTNDVPALAAKTEKLLNEEEDMSIPDVVFPELEYILLEKYGSSRAKISEAYKFLIEKPTIKASSSVKKAVSLYESTNLDMADCIIAVESLKGQLASFDRNLLKIENVKPFWK